MKIKDISAANGSYITIEVGDFDSDFVHLSTVHTAAHAEEDELWVFKRKAFLKAVAKALNVVIYDYDAENDWVGHGKSGYYK